MMKTRWISPILAALVLISLVAFTGCSEDDTISTPDNNTGGDKIETVDNGDGSFSVVVDAGGTTAFEWVYFSFANGELEVTDPATDLNWDLRFKFYSVQLNGGVNGSAGLEVAHADGVEFADMVVAPADGYITDADGADAFKTDGGWYTYNPMTHETVLNNRVWCVRLRDGSFVKMVLDNLVDGAGSPGYPGFTWQAL